MNISIKQKASIVGLGSVSTLLVLLMTEVFFAQLLTNFLINNIGDNLMLLIIIIGLVLLTIVVAFIVGYFVTGDIALKSVRNASILSLACLFLFLFVVCNGFLYWVYPHVYNQIYSFEILIIFPQVLVYFSIYILDSIFSLFVMIIVVYYVLFVFFLEKLYIEKVVY